MCGCDDGRGGCGEEIVSIGVRIGLFCGFSFGILGIKCICGERIDGIE